MNNTSLVSKEDLKIALDVIKQIREESAQDQNYGFTDEFDTFIMKMMCLTPQSYGSRLQQYLINRFNLTPISANKDSGDFVDQFGQPHEFKASIITPTNINLNLVQIRQWQEIAGYFCVAIDTRQSPFKERVFQLSKEQMQNEIKIMKATAAHGTKNSNKNNAHVELRLSIPLIDGNEDFERWKTNYQKKGITLNKSSVANV